MIFYDLKIYFNSNTGNMHEYEYLDIQKIHIQILRLMLAWIWALIQVFFQIIVERHVL